MACIAKRSRATLHEVELMKNRKHIVMSIVCLSVIVFGLSMQDVESDVDQKVLEDPGKINSVQVKGESADAVFMFTDDTPAVLGVSTEYVITLWARNVTDPIMSIFERDRLEANDRGQLLIPIKDFSSATSKQLDVFRAGKEILFGVFVTRRGEGLNNSKPIRFPINGNLSVTR